MKKNYEIEDVIELLKPYRTDEENESYLFTEEQGEKILAQCPEIVGILWNNNYYVDYDSRSETIFIVR